ncbi:hypothetical protein LR48_Vigan01g187500 [Vigna angularis]|uniref:Uncharacterized protein n=1 Tax=Phaseolus angularis TaxID=3914 RepID=A0A0L9TQ73_PHAAN|nr:hypothetical protein LR48_Vigan01g187500 [Vigna angularis]
MFNQVLFADTVKNLTVQIPPWPNLRGEIGIAYVSDDGGEAGEIDVVFRDLFGGGFGAEAAWTGGAEKVSKCVDHV